MATFLIIDERAKAASIKHFPCGNCNQDKDCNRNKGLEDGPWFCPHCGVKEFEQGYFCGATEQHAIDIENAWQWMRQHIHLIGSEMELHSQFVKAMEL